MSEPSFIGVLEGLRCGPDDAATIVRRRFVRRLVALAERQFNHRLRARADHEDVVQSAFRSAFRRIGLRTLLCHHSPPITTRSSASPPKFLFRTFEEG